MLGRSRWSLVLLLCVGSLSAAEPKGKIVEEIWHSAYLEGNKSGYLRTVIEQLERDGTPILRTTTELSLTVKRFNNVAQLRMETGTDETLDGKVLSVVMRHFNGKQQVMVVTGTVKGNVLECVGNGMAPFKKQVPWNDKVLGLARQERLFQERKPRPGDSFSYLSYEPTIVAVVNNRVTVGKPEEVEVLGVKQRLLRVEASTDRIQDVQLPTLASWLGDDLRVVRSEVDMPGLGKLVLYRTTARQATEKGSLAKAVDIGVTQLLPVNRRILQPYETTAAVYRIRLKGDNDPGSAFVQDSRQKVRNISGDSFDLVVNASRGPSANPNAPPANKEFLESCYFINSEDGRVKELARSAVGTEIDPWKKALRIERWVHHNIQETTFTEALATADQVARTLKGDCTEYAMLTAAMCRAAEVPSRTACGLIYVDSNRGPVFGFHMWTEVYVQGQWLPLDATLGRGYVGATHIKVTDHSWHEIQSLTPLLPVVRVLGKLSIDVVQTQAP